MSISDPPPFRQASLPVVHSSTPLLAAIERMQEAGVSALVAMEGQEAKVLTVEDLLPALRERGDVPVGMVAPETSRLRTRSLELVGTGEAAEAQGVAEVSERSVWDEVPLGFERGLEAEPEDSVALIVSVQDDLAIVMTSNESRAAVLVANVVLCRCRDDRTHVWRPTELARRGQCNWDGEPVDCR